jgi:hypothetical protein
MSEFLDTVDKAYKIAESVPGMRILDRTFPNEQGPHWTVTFEGIDYSMQVGNAKDLLQAVKNARDYWERRGRPMRVEPVVYPYDPGRTLAERSRRDMIREACAIAESCPDMIVEELKGGGWLICFKDDDYHTESKSTVDLLRDVKEAKDYYEALQNLKEGEQERMKKSVKLDEEEDEEEEKHYIRHETEVEVVKGDGIVIRVDGLDRETKELFLHIIENLTIKEASAILGKDYPCSTWDELHFIREKLRKSLESSEKRR